MIVSIINLARSTERREIMKAQMEGLGIKYFFFEAVDGLDPNIPLPFVVDQDLAGRRHGFPLVPGEIGCYASHYKMWQYIAAQDRPIAILEDDIELNDDFGDLLAMAYECIRGHDMIRLFALTEKRFDIIRECPDRRTLIRYRRGPCGAQAYLLAPSGARKLLAKSSVISIPVDNYIDWYWEHGVDSLALIPYSVSCNRQSRSSTIDMTGRTAIGRKRKGHLFKKWNRIRRDAYNIGRELRALLGRSI